MNCLINYHPSFVAIMNFYENEKDTYFKDHYQELFNAAFAKNEQQLLDKIISLYKEPKNQQPIMHQYAIDNFSSEKICDSFTKLYREALN